MTIHLCKSYNTVIYFEGNALVAQWIEHRFPKPGVVGSIPTGSAILILLYR